MEGAGGGGGDYDDYYILAQFDVHRLTVKRAQVTLTVTVPCI